MYYYIGYDEFNRAKARVLAQERAAKDEAEHNHLWDEMDKLYKFNPWMVKAIKKIVDINLSKGGDYASSMNPFVNFESVASAVGTDVDLVFRQFIACKMDRLRNLMDRGKTPNNESIDDTKLDLAVYAIMYLAYSFKERDGSSI